MKAVSIEQTGGPEVLRCEERPVPEPATGEVLVKLEASGVNFTDLNQRSGVNKISLPAVLGVEGAGTVEKLGEAVTRFGVGDRVAYAMVRGSYAEYAVVPARMLVRVPQSIDFRVAAGAMLQGLTAQYLTHTTFPVKPGHTVLIHAAAGGTGRLLVQMAAMRGARVIGTAGSEAKALLAREAGASDVLLYDEQDWVSEVRRLTNGVGVDVVYDSVGAKTFLKGLDCLKPRGMMVHFGVSSGQTEPFDTRALTQKGSLMLARPTLNTHIADADELAQRSSDVFSWISAGKLRVRIDREYEMADAAQAHRDLEARLSTGKFLLKIA